MTKKTLSSAKLSSLTTILIIGESTDFGESLRLLLQTPQLRLLTVADGLSALSLLSREEPTLILVKANLPALSGWKLCHIIRKNLTLQHVPILLLHKKQGIFSRLHAWFVMANVLYPEPQNITEWVRLIRRLLEINPSNTMR